MSIFFETLKEFVFDLFAKLCTSLFGNTSKVSADATNTPQ